MTHYARIDAGRVVECLTLPDGIEPAAAFHATIADTLVPCNDTVTPGMTYVAGVFSQPVVAPSLPPEKLAALIRAECSRRIFDVASANTQMNMTAARAAGLLDADDVSAYAASLTWVAAMRAAATALIAAADTAFADAAKWPACPADVLALAAKF